MRHIKLKPEIANDEEAIILLIHSAYKDIKDRLLVD